MSKIDELIKEKCPNGVEFKPLCEVTKLTAGDRIIKSMMSNDALYPVMGGGDKPTGKYVDYNFEHSVTISRAGSAGSVNWLDGKFWATDVCFVASQKEDDLCIKFVYYYLCSQQPILKTKIYGGNLPKLNKQFLWDLPIPLPPLEIQQEIVRILDNFTELESALESELTKRKEQYEYYRDQLLSFENLAGEGGQVEWLTLGELCNVSAGGDVPKNALFNEKSYSHSVPIISNGIGKNALYGYTSQAKITKTAVTVSARGTVGHAEYRDYPYYPIVRLLSVIPNDIARLNTKYLYYCLQGRKYKLPTSGIPQLTAPNLKNQKIPVPSAKVQERIVYVLDNFDAVCNDLNIGLPAEIEARQKQYEYYRDRLLSFDDASGGIERERERIS